MKSSFFITAFLVPLSVFGSPEPEAEAKPLPEPQNPLVGLIGAGIFLGTLSALGSKLGGGSPGAGAGGKCECSRTPSVCAGSRCECQNESVINCWVQKRGACAVQISQCPATAQGSSGLPTPPGSQYPPCGGGLSPLCSGNKYCKKLDNNCVDPEHAGRCLGICVPNFDTTPKGKGPAKGKGKGYPKGAGGAVPPPPPTPPGLCPTNFQCQPGTVCVVDPRSTNSFLCTAPTDICAGWKNDPCPGDKVCVRDPRTNCVGQGCTGICA